MTLVYLLSLLFFMGLQFRFSQLEALIKKNDSMRHIFPAIYIQGALHKAAILLILKVFLLPSLLELILFNSNSKALWECFCHLLFTHLQPSSTSLVIISVPTKPLWMGIFSFMYTYLLHIHSDTVQDCFKVCI